MSISSKGYRYARTGPIASVLKLEAYQALGFNADTDVVIKMTHAPLHRHDAGVINGSAIGRQSATQASAEKSCEVAPFPRVGGNEGIGEVVDAGRSATLRQGDKVWISPTAGVGTWATHVVANGSHVHKVPAGAKNLGLASCGTSLITGVQLCSRDFAKINEGDAVLLNGGSSLAALVAAKVAKGKGATVYAAAAPGARFGDAQSRMKAAGAAAVVEYNAKGAREIAAAVKGKRVALFGNGVGGPAFNDFARLVGDRGAVVTYGAQHGFGLMWAGGNQIFGGFDVVGFFAPRYLRKLSYADRQRVFEDAVQHTATVSYPVKEVKSLEGLPDAWDATYLGGGAKHVLTL